MHQSGKESVAATKQNGMWTFMDDVDALIISDDLASRLQKRKKAAAIFESGSPSYRRNVLRWLKLAKTEATRKKQLEKIFEFLSRNENPSV